MIAGDFAIYRLIRNRGNESSWIGIVFVPVGVIGILEAWYFLPQFRM